MISGLVLKYLNGECFVIRRGYETTLPVSSSFCLTVPTVDLAVSHLADHIGHLAEAFRAKLSSEQINDAMQAERQS